MSYLFGPIGEIWIIGLLAGQTTHFQWQGSKLSEQFLEPLLQCSSGAQVVTGTIAQACFFPVGK